MSVAHCTSSAPIKHRDQARLYLDVTKDRPARGH
jgi:hypothetical protein